MCMTQNEIFRDLLPRVQTGKYRQAVVSTLAVTSVKDGFHSFGICLAVIER